MTSFRVLLIFGIVGISLHSWALPSYNRLGFKSLDDGTELTQENPVAIGEGPQQVDDQDQASNENDSKEAADVSVKLVSIRAIPAAHAVHQASKAASHEVTMYTVQLSSYLTEGEAQTQLAQLQKALPDAWISTATVDGKNRYRICSGHFQTWKEALSARVTVAEKSGIKEAFVQKLFSPLTAQNETL